MERTCVVAATLFAAAMVIINVIQIFFRYVLNMAFVWVFPATMLLFIWMTFLGAFVVYRRKKDIVVGFIVNLVPAGGRAIISLITNVLTILLLVWILSEAPTVFKRQASIMQVIPLPRYVQAIPLFMGAAGILLQYFLETVELIKTALSRTEQKRHSSP